MFPSLLPALLLFSAAGWHLSSVWRASAPWARGRWAGGLPAAAPTCFTAHPSIPACLPLNPLISSSLDLSFCTKICLISRKSFTYATGRGGPMRPCNASRIAVGSTQVCSVYCIAAGSLWGYSSKSFKSNHTSEVI